MMLRAYEFQGSTVFDGGLTDFDGVADVDTFTREATLTALFVTETGECVDLATFPGRARVALEEAAVDAVEEELFG